MSKILVVVQRVSSSPPAHPKATKIKTMTNKQKIVTVHHTLSSSPNTNCIEIAKVAQDATDQGWTLRGTAVHDGVMYLTFARKERE